MRSKDVRKLPCSDHLKEVIHRCLGSRGRRYQAAGELIAALRHRPKELSKGRVASLAGKRLSITGFLRRPRSEAFAAARKAGAIIQSKPGLTTDVLVRGRPNQLQIAGDDAGTKLMEIRRLAALGQPDHHHRRTAVLETGRVKVEGAAAQRLSYCGPRARVDIQISVPPTPPTRLDAKSSVRPPLERLGCCSAAVEFSGAPAFTGGVQGSCTLRRVDVPKIRSADPTESG